MEMADATIEQADEAFNHGFKMETNITDPSSIKLSNVSLPDIVSVHLHSTQRIV
jgi:hypothetical protein